MTDVQWERWARAMGVVFAVLVVASFLLFGEAPTLEDDAESVASFYRDNGGRVLAAVTIFAFAFIPLFWFVGAMAHALRSRGEGRLAATLVGLIAAWASTQFVLVASAAPLAVSVAETVDPDITYGLNALGLGIDNVGAFPLAGAIAAASVGLARVRLLPSWFLWFGAAVAMLVLLRGTTWASKGFWSPGGEYIFIVVAVAVLWTIVTSVLLFRAPLPGDKPLGVNA